MATFNWFLPPTYSLSQPQIFQSGIGTSVALTVKGASGQSVDIFRVQDSSGTNVMRLDNSGNLTIAGTANVSLNEAITGNIALTGTLSVTGTSAFTGAVTMASTLRVTSATTLGVVSIGNTLTVTDTATFNGSSVFNGAVSFAGSAVGFPNGTVSAPGISFSSDTDTGFYRIGANNLGVTTNGVKQFDFSTTANTSALQLAITPLAISGGSSTFIGTPAAHTTVTAEVIDFSHVAHTMTITGGYSTQRFTNFAQPTISAGSALTVTTASTVNIDAAPTVASSAKITNTLGLQVGGATTVNNIAPSTYGAISVPAHTVTLSSTTTISSANFAAGLALGIITVAQSGGAVTVNTASSLYIAGSPAAGSSVTLTSPWSIFVDAGICRFDDHLQFGAGVAVVAAAYSIGRDAGGTNQLALNVPTGAGFILSVNGTSELTLSSTTLGLAANTITGVGSDITGTTATALTISVPNTASGAGGSITIKAGAAGGGSGAGGSILLYPQAGSGAGSPGTIQFADTSGTARLQLTPDTTSGSASTNDMLFTASATYITYFGTAGFTSTKDFAILRTASAVNWLQVTGGATGVMPVISAQGETNVSINLTPKGTSGRVNITAGNLNLATSANILINAANPLKTLFLSAAGASFPTTTPMVTGSLESSTNQVKFVTAEASDSGGKLFAEWAVTMPASWDGSTVTAKFQWTANSTSTNGVVWGLQARAFGDDVTLDQAFGTAQEVTDANTGTTLQTHLSAATSAITIAGSPAGGQLVVFRAYRDSNNGSDTLAVTASLIGIQVIYGTSTYSD